MITIAIDQRTLTIGGKITEQLISSLTGLDLVALLRSNNNISSCLVESNPVKLGTHPYSDPSPHKVISVPSIERLGKFEAVLTTNFRAQKYFSIVKKRASLRHRGNTADGYYNFRAKLTCKDRFKNYCFRLESTGGIIVRKGQFDFRF